MKYESNILKRLIDTYGVVGNPRYISEIIKEFIVKGKERFPDLFTYQADWLAHIDEFGLNPSYTVSYTGQSIYAPNTLESPVKSAILKGQTLVNLIRTMNKTILEQYQDVVNVQYIEPSTKYLLKIKNNTSEIKSFYSGEITEWTNIDIDANQTITKILTTKSTLGRNTLLQNAKTHTTEHDLSVIFIKYQQGMENWDIPYFEGMQSVKMPVLTTTGKNLFDGELESGVLSLPPEGSKPNNVPNSNYVRSTNKISVLPNTVYTISSEITSEWYVAFINQEGNYASNPKTSGGYASLTFTTPSDCYFIRFYKKSTDVELQVQLEEGSTATPYEPYKSNILTVNEPVELRGIGDVQDTLDCLTSEVTERIGEVVLDGSDDEGWSKVSVAPWTNDTYVAFEKTIQTTGIPRWNVNGKYTLNNKYQDISYDDGRNNGVGCFVYDGGGKKLCIRQTTFTTLTDFKSYLQSNPITVQYQLATESIKTVDLTILDQNGQNVKQLMSFNGGTHFNTGSLEGSLLPSVSVSVETDLEETLKVCSLEGNTM